MRLEGSVLFLPPWSVEPSVFLIFYRLSRAAHQPQALPVGCFQVPMKFLSLSLSALLGRSSQRCLIQMCRLCVHCTTAE